MIRLHQQHTPKQLPFLFLRHYLTQVIFNLTVNSFPFSPSHSQTARLIPTLSGLQQPLLLPSSHSPISSESNIQSQSSISILDSHGLTTISKQALPSSTLSYLDPKYDKNRHYLQQTSYCSLEIFFHSHYPTTLDLSHQRGLTCFRQLIWCMFLSLPLLDLWDAWDRLVR